MDNQTAQSGRVKMVEFWLVIGAEPSSKLDLEILATRFYTRLARLEPLFNAFLSPDLAETSSDTTKHRQQTLEAWHIEQHPIQQYP